MTNRPSPDVLEIFAEKSRGFDISALPGRESGYSSKRCRCGKPARRLWCSDRCGKIAAQEARSVYFQYQCKICRKLFDHQVRGARAKYCKKCSPVVHGEHNNLRRKRIRARNVLRCVDCGVNAGRSKRCAPCRVAWRKRYEAELKRRVRAGIEVTLFCHDCSAIIKRGKRCKPCGTIRNCEMSRLRSRALKGKK